MFSVTYEIEISCVKDKNGIMKLYRIILFFKICETWNCFAFLFS